MEFAYARVSASDQNLERQLEAFKNFGIDTQNIFADKKSGKNFDRTAYRKLIKKLKKGDLLVIKSIDRLGRNYDAIISEWAHITHHICADIIVLDMPLLDTRTKATTLIGKFISNTILQVLSFVAENERENIKVRQAEGIAVARSRGIKFGRPRKTYTDEYVSTVMDYVDKKIDLQQALSKINVSRQNFYYNVKQVETQRYEQSLYDF